MKNGALRDSGRLGLTLAALLLLIAALPAAAPAETDAPLAVLLSFNGDVSVVRSDGGHIDGTFGLPLEGGDEVRTGADSQAEIFFQTGNWIQVGANSSMKVQGPPKGSPARSVEAPAVEEGEEGEEAEAEEGRSFELVQNFLTLKDSEGTSALVGLRSAGGRPALRTLSPCQTTILEKRPTFYWQCSDDSKELKLTLYGEDGVVWEKTAQGVASLEYPESAPELVPGVSYSWSLETTDPLQMPPLRSQAAFFDILGSQDRHELDASLASLEKQGDAGGATYHLVRASYYFEKGLIENAIQETREAIDKDPGSPVLRSILARLYAEVGRTEEALGEYDRILGER
jgi:tetratricopeptide (TPR) repeat protein